MNLINKHTIQTSPTDYIENVTLYGHNGVCLYNGSPSAKTHIKKNELENGLLLVVLNMNSRRLQIFKNIVINQAQSTSITSLCNNLINTLK